MRVVLAGAPRVSDATTPEIEFAMLSKLSPVRGREKKNYRQAGAFVDKPDEEARCVPRVATKLP